MFFFNFAIQERIEHIIVFSFCHIRKHQALCYSHNMRSSKLFFISIVNAFISLRLNGEKAELINEHENKCDVYLAPSLIPGAGRGIFAGKSYAQGDFFDKVSSITILRKNGVRWPLHNYVYGSNDNKYSMALFGTAMMFNHGDSKNVDHYWDAWPVISISEQKKEPYTIYTTVTYTTTRDIEIGDEIYTSYGDKEWFNTRGIAYDHRSTEAATKSKYTAEDLALHGHCMSDVFVDESTIPLAGKGLFTKRSFKKGEIISISPVLVLPKHAVAADEGVLLNYCIASTSSDVALFPIGLIALANHGGSDSNVAITWFAWDDEERFSEKLKQKPDELLKAHFAQIDIAITATRDIAVGEELLLFYGEPWESSYVEHLDRLDEWVEEGEADDKKPQFRAPIEAPEGLFPKWWRGSCIGPDCQMVDRQAEIDNSPEMRKKQEAAKANIQAAIQRAKQLARKTYVKPGTGTCANKNVESNGASKGLIGSIMSFWTNSESRDK